MTAKVAIVPIHDNHTAALHQAIDLLGGIASLNTPARDVTIKIGLFDPRQQHHSSIDVVHAIIDAFDQSPRVYLAESDNYCGKALDRLERFSGLCGERVSLCSLSDDPQARTIAIAGGEMPLSHVLFKPHVLVSTHVLRTFEKGSVLKNLFGCTPMVQKAKFHKNEIFANQLCDIYEAAGGIDLAVMDGTFLRHAASDKKLPLDLLIVGRDAVAVETVGAVLAGLKPHKMPVIQEFVRRGLGEGNIDNIEIVGVSPQEYARLKTAHKELKALVESAPRQPGLSNTIDALIGEGWLDTFRTAVEVAAELQARGVGNATKVMVDTTLKRRVGKTLERAKDGAGWVYRRRQEGSGA